MPKDVAVGYGYNPEWEREQSTLTEAIATPLPVVHQDAPTGEISGSALLIALLTSVMISVAVTMVMTPKMGIGR